MIGSSVFSKYLTQNFRIKLPTGINAIGVNGESATWFLIHGRVKQSIDLNEYTNPILGGTGRDVINSHINTYVKPYFDNRYDMLSFDTKISKHIKVIRKLKLKTNRNTDINVTQTGGSAPFSAGSAPEDLYVTVCKWTTHRKVHYDEGKPSNDPDDTEFLYPGQNSWIPSSYMRISSARPSTKPRTSRSQPPRSRPGSPQSLHCPARPPLASSPARPPTPANVNTRTHTL